MHEILDDIIPRKNNPTYWSLLLVKNCYNKDSEDVSIEMKDLQEKDFSIKDGN